MLSIEDSCQHLDTEIMRVFGKLSRLISTTELFERLTGSILIQGDLTSGTIRSACTY